MSKIKSNKDCDIKHLEIQIEQLMDNLERMYPDAHCTLDFENPLQLLIATQLAAQCTDNRVNIVTKELFEKYKCAEDFANSDLIELQQDIKSTGFYHRKAENIKETCKIIRDKHKGNVPDNMEDLLILPGVGRKTANVILGVIYEIPGIIVDTHAKRLSLRIGLTKNQDPERIEYDLMCVIPKRHWVKFCHCLVYHGRAVCNARNPKCEHCKIQKYCKYGLEKIG